jgi:transposase
MEAQETRAILTRAQAGVQKALHEVEMSLRGVLRGFGLKIGKVAPTQFEARIRELVEGHPSLEVIATSMLAVRACCGVSSTVRPGRRHHRGADLRGGDR